MSSVIARYLSKTVQCSVCDGHGEIMNPTWEIYFTQHKDDGNIDIAWFEKAGYVHELPPRKIVCRNCDGKGTVEQEITLDEYVDGITDHVSRLEFVVAVLSKELRMLKLEINSLRNI